MQRLYFDYNILEDIAKDKLGLVYEGEIVFQDENN